MEIGREARCLVVAYPYNATAQPITSAWTFPDGRLGDVQRQRFIGSPSRNRNIPSWKFSVCSGSASSIGSSRMIYRSSSV